jgi:hypothetical protein
MTALVEVDRGALDEGEPVIEGDEGEAVIERDSGVEPAIERGEGRRGARR